MNPLKQMLKRAQEDLAEIGDTLHGSHSQRILDDEIRRVDAALGDLRNEILDARARRFTAGERSQALASSIAEREDQAAKALRQRKKSLAREIALLISGLERDLAEEKQQIARIRSHVAQLQHLVQQGDAKLRRLKQQLDTIRISESLQRAQEAVGDRRARAGSPRSALDLFKRARDTWNKDGPPPVGGACEEGDGQLDARLRKAGIIDDQQRADAVLARLEKRMKVAAPRGSSKPSAGIKP